MYETGSSRLILLISIKTHHNSDDVFNITNTQTIILTISIIDRAWAD